VTAKTEIPPSVVVGSARDQIRDECHDDGSRHASAKCSCECQKCLKNTRASESVFCVSVGRAATFSTQVDALRVRLQEAALRATALLSGTFLFRNRACFLQSSQKNHNDNMHLWHWKNLFSLELDFLKLLSVRIEKKSKRVCIFHNKKSSNIASCLRCNVINGIL